MELNKTPVSNETVTLRRKSSIKTRLPIMPYNKQSYYRPGEPLRIPAG